MDYLKIKNHKLQILMLKKFYLLLSICLIFTSCLHFDSTIEKDILSRCDFTNDNYCQVPLIDLIDKSWTILYVIEGPRWPDELNEFMKSEHKFKLQPDDCIRYYFFNGKKFIAQKSVYVPKKLSYLEALGDPGCMVLSNTDTLSIWKLNDRYIIENESFCKY